MNSLELTGGKCRLQPWALCRWPVVPESNLQLVGAVQKLVDVGAGIEKLVRDQQSRHQDQPLVAQGAMLLHQGVEFRFEIVGDLFETVNFTLAASEAVGAIVEAYRYLSQPTWRRRRPPA